jgi:DNA methylase
MKADRAQSKDSRYDALVIAARDSAPVSGLTHNYYRYPARFSPKFVRSAIELFSDPGDLVLDPFMGGGTTLVEAIALGRQALGADISSLAAFVSEIKTTVYSEQELIALRRWSRRAVKAVHMHSRAVHSWTHSDGNYHRNMRSVSTWRLRKAIAQLLFSATQLSSKLEGFARCATLRTAQWALDGRRHLPSIEDFRAAFPQYIDEMIEGATQLRESVTRFCVQSTPIVQCLNRSSVGLESDPVLKLRKTPKLILTSPPYPGVHVLYHRWQVDGRKETAAPFWIANRLDGEGASYYTMGDRRARNLEEYFDTMRATLGSIANICDRETVVVQVVAFSEPEWQLPRYISVADDAGFAEFFLPNLQSSPDGRLWRVVPNRKWHADLKGATHGCQEAVLFHRLSSPECAPKRRNS